MKRSTQSWLQPAAILLLVTSGHAFAGAAWSRAIPEGFGSGGVCPVGYGGEEGEIDLFRAAGLRISRMDFQWEKIEDLARVKEKGQYYFDEYDAITGALTKAGIRPLYILDYANRLYEPNQSIVTEAGREAFVRWAAAAAKRYAGKGIVWEIWNEPNIFFWSPQTATSIEDYVKLVAAVAPKIRGADPNAVIIGPATSGIPHDWLEKSFRLGLLEHIDGVSVHPYRREAPETVVPEYERLRALIARYAPPGKEIPILSTEWGYTCGARGLGHMPVLSREEQAAHLLRMFLIHRWQGVPVNIWFDWKNWSDDWNNPDANAGIVTSRLEPKTAYVALQVLSRELDGFAFERKEELPEKDIYLLAFRKADRMAYAFWTTGSKREAGLAFRSAQGGSVEFRLSVSQNPCYIFLPEEGAASGRVRLMSMYGEAAQLEWPAFEPGKVWRDDAGKPIQAHGGGILLRDGVYYWYGEEKTHGNLNRVGVACYSSRDLLRWKSEGIVLPKDALPEAFRDRGICERPKVIHCPKTGKFVCWMHLDDERYLTASAGVAVADAPAGPFRFLRHGRPIQYDFGYPGDDRANQKGLGGTYRDMNLFVDDDGKAYVFYASEDNKTMYVVRLDEEFTAAESPPILGKTWARILIDQLREAPAPFKYKDTHYLITSGCTGWGPNAARYATAKHILGPWETHGNPCIGAERDKTFRSQSTFVLPAPGKPAGCYIFMADRWVPEKLGKSTYIWLPFVIRDDGSLVLEFRDRWDLSVFDRLPRSP